MKFILVATLLAPIAAHATLADSIANQHAANACFVQDVKQALHGDFSNWVLPDFVPGAHKRAGQYQLPDCSWR